MNDAETMINVEHVYKVFGPSPRDALARLDRGEDRESIRKATGNVIALADASLEVRRGEILVLMGLSGSGKSTLLRCLNSLVRPDRGRVLIEGTTSQLDPTAADAETLRQIRLTRISMVFQRHSLLPWRTLRQNVALGLEFRDLGRAEINAIVDEKLELVGLGDWKDKYPEELSGGMQQRVGLARALATDADILLLDEPLSALDPLIRMRMQDELLALQRMLKKTMIFVSHDLDEALRLGSRIALMEAGRVVQLGTPEQIVTSPATEYVKRFVANVNPLSILRGDSLMQPLSSLPRDPADARVLLLDRAGSCRCTLSAEGRPAALSIRGHAARLVPYDETLALKALSEDVLISGPLETSMRTALAVNHATGRPMLLLDGDGRLRGVISEWDLLRAMAEDRAGKPTELGGDA
ncbi:quaternary amine ABC transporter ATP-binding protein [Melittangium boletus]|uniref:Proline/glycine betaine ABC transporter ATP-binding protein n=1 Tax=Melittangium boletus DSM 14713 TaxID=1294270 RepID=A0A250INL4_9BACT|nr:ATP-binding cassette domain-containing protein [Melittangium boletus]ATB33334.1 proline/glycine betaine ABC transporter ATP-binding protein [Melittangium boletus DSM 14713]